MMNKSTNLLLMLMLILSVPISISSNSWFMVWMGMEINMMAFLPMIMDHKGLMAKESALTYFMVQTIASMLMLMSIIMMMINFNMLNYIPSNTGETLMLSALMMKSGISPFHFWMPKLMEGMNWIKCMILMTWQKITPLMMMSNIIKMNYWALTAMILSVVVGAIGGLNQTSLRKLMAYSSISNNGWMMAAILISENMWLMYFSFYSIMTIIMSMTMHFYKNYHINQLISMNETVLKKFFLMMNMLSISGLPPMMGFLPKWLVIQSNLMLNEITLMSIMIMVTLITIYYYLRIMMSMLMLSNYENKWQPMYINKYNNTMMMLSTMSIMGLTMTTLVITMY
nr:NADH dehydrogenase subunit 2 [Phryganistria guangxiensis]